MNFRGVPRMHSECAYHPPGLLFDSLILFIGRWFHRDTDGADFMLLDFRDGMCDLRVVFVEVGVSVDVH
jgi:hypothetical protein